MLILLTLLLYILVFVFSLSFYATPIGSRAIYHGVGAVVIDMLAIAAGAYVIHFAHLAGFRGIGAPWVLVSVMIGAVVSAMHLAKWIIRYRFRRSAAPVNATEATPG